MGCFAGYLVGREAARRLVPLGRGTVIFTGASGSLRGKPGFAQFAAAKAGLRMIAQSMAREWGPKGIQADPCRPRGDRGGINRHRLLSRAPDPIQRGEHGLLSTERSPKPMGRSTARRVPPGREVDLRLCKEPF